MQDTTRGEYGGLGIEITSDEAVIKIISPMDGTPAARAGLKPGDYITAVNGQSVLGLTVNDAVKQMRGKVGESVTLTIAREKTDPFDVKLTREIIQPKSVTSKLEGDYGYVRLSGFNEKATDETRAAIVALEAKDPHLKGLVLDPAQQSGRPARPGGRRLQPVPRRRRDRLSARPRSRAASSASTPSRAPRWATCLWSS